MISEVMLDRESEKKRLTCILVSLFVHFNVIYSMKYCLNREIDLDVIFKITLNGVILTVNGGFLRARSDY